MSQNFHLADRAFLVIGGRPDLAQPRPQPVHGLQLPRFASQVGLSEAMFAVLTAWLLPGEAITVSQAVGGAVVLLRLALARQGDRTEKVGDEPLAGRASPSVAMWPEMEELQTGQTAVRR